MSILRKASTETVRIPLDDTDYIVVRAEIAKGDFNKFIGYMPQRQIAEAPAEGAEPEETKLTTAEAVELQKGLFEALVVGWSLPEEPTVEAYLSLSSDAAMAVDTAVAEHFKTLQPSKAEEKAGFRPS